MLPRLSQVVSTNGLRMIQHNIGHSGKRLQAAGLPYMQRSCVQRLTYRRFSSQQLTPSTPLHRSVFQPRSNHVVQLSRRQWMLIAASASQQLGKHSEACQLHRQCRHSEHAAGVKHTALLPKLDRRHEQANKPFAAVAVHCKRCCMHYWSVSASKTHPSLLTAVFYHSWVSHISSSS